MKHLIFGCMASALLMGGSAYAHPHADSEKETAEKEWPYFGGDTSTDTPEALAEMDKTIKSHAERMTRHMERARKLNEHIFSKVDQKDLLKNPDKIREAARALEDMIAESDILENMAELVIDLAEDIEVEGDEDGMALSFDGKTLGKLKVERNGHVTESLNVEGMGKNMSVDKETFYEKGKKRTRIVIEMDADEDVDVKLKPKKN